MTTKKPVTKKPAKKALDSDRGLQPAKNPPPMPKVKPAKKEPVAKKPAAKKKVKEIKPVDAEAHGVCSLSDIFDLPGWNQDASDSEFDAFEKELGQMDPHAMIAKDISYLNDRVNQLSFENTKTNKAAIYLAWGFGISIVLNIILAIVAIN